MWLFALLPFLACSGPSKPTDLVAEFQSEPERVMEWVRGLDDPVLQEGAILTLVDAYPGKTGALCASLGEGAPKRRCERSNQRPHLWTIRTTQGPEPRRTRRGGGPLNARLVLPAEMMTRWQDTEAEPGSCQPDSAEYHVCLQTDAIAFASQGDVESAARRCLAASTDRWRQDCFFSAAEAVPLDEAFYGRALDLCLGAGSFSPECHGHVLLTLRPANSRGDSDRLEDHADAFQAAQWLEDYWRERSPEMGALVLESYWCSYAHSIMERSPLPVGNAFDYLPPLAWPHLRDALAIMLMDEPDPLAAVQQAMQRRVPRQKGILDAAPPDLDLRVQFWEKDLPGEEVIPAIYFLDHGGGRRPVDPDVDVDLLLGVSTVLGHRKPPRIDLIAAGLEDEHPIVRWNAARILSRLQPDHPALEKARTDEDPLVRARAQATHRPPRHLPPPNSTP